MSSKLIILRITLLTVLLFISLISIGCEQISDKFNEWKESDFFNESETTNNLTTTAITTTIKTNIPTKTTKPVITTTPADEINISTGKYKNYYLGIVFDSGIAVSGSGCYDSKGEFIILINNSNAKNPTYAELLSFLRNDNTESFPYKLSYSLVGSYYGSAKSNVDIKRIKDIINEIIQPDTPNICADFAERLHNNAEKAGIRCGYVLGTNHAFNVFETTDKGLIYIDDVGTSYGPSGDVLITVGTDKKIRQQWLFPEQSMGWSLDGYVGGDVYFESIIWDGKW